MNWEMDTPILTPETSNSNSEADIDNPPIYYSSYIQWMSEDILITLGPFVRTEPLGIYLNSDPIYSSC